MRKVALILLFRLSLLVAIAASAALYIEYQNAGDPAFCGVGTGCMAVRLSPYSRPFGIPLPTLGLAAFSGLFAMAVFGRATSRRAAETVLAALGGAIAIILLVLQAAAIGTFCVWCVAVDTSAIVAATSAILLYLSADAKSAPEPPLLVFSHGALRAVWGVAFAAAISLPFVWARYPVIPPAPAPIAALQVPGKVTLVNFTDFECPFCRRNHPLLHAIEEQNAGRVVVIRKMMPLSIHRGAMPAALAYMCVPESTRERMANALYNAPTLALTKEGTIAIAAGLGLDEKEVTRCVESSEARAKVDEDMEMFRQIEGGALPLTYVGPRAVLGYYPEKVIAFVETALAGGRPSLRLSWMFGALGLVFAAAAVLSWVFASRASGENDPSTPQSSR